MPVEETIVVFPNPDSDALWEEKITSHGINLIFCGSLLAGFAIIAIEPDLFPAF